MKRTMPKNKKTDFSFINKEVGQIKCLNSRFFSLPLMWEGIKQTKILGIFFFIFTVIAGCIIPFTKIINFANMSGDLASQQSVEDVSFIEFYLPILTLWIIFPIILVTALFRFMNERAASDFYHSVPLSRTCIYITYSLSVFLWGIASILVSTVLSYCLYLVAPNYIMVPVNFMGSTILASIIAMFLSMSATLLAKGLSGTGFSNIAIAILIMYAPRVIIFVFAQSIINVAQVATITGIGFVSPTLNILLTPFFSSVIEPSTIWYSLILGIVYYILGLIAHKFRKSETAGKSSSYKGVQHVVRSAFGFVPLLVICYALATRYELSSADWVIYIGSSLIIYLLYEFATTRSGKKLLISIPLYMIVVAFGGIFVWGSLTISNSIIDDIPEVSDIESVSLSNFNEYSAIDRKSYYIVKYADYEFTNEELIKILQESLVDNVNKIKKDGFVPDGFVSDYNGNFEEYQVIFHTKSGRDIERHVVINTKKYFDDDDISGVAEFVYKDEKYSEIFTKLPSSDEIQYIGFGSEDRNAEQSIKEHIDVVWNTFVTEFEGMSKEEKISLVLNEYGESIGLLDVSGYIGDDYFCSKFNINSVTAPKTYSKIANIYNESIREDIKRDVIDTISKDSDIQIFSGYNNQYNDQYFSLERGNELFYLRCEDEANKALATGYFDDLKKYYNFNFDSTKYYTKVKEILDIIYEASKNEFDINSANPMFITINYLAYNEDFDYESYEYTYLFANLSTEQYNRIAKIYEELAKNGTKIEESENIE